MKMKHITRSPQNKTENNHQLSFFDSARSAFKHILDNTELNGGSILLPSYIGITDREGSGVFDPISSSKIPFTFYSVNNKVQPDFSEIKKIITNQKISMILLIHYFGFYSKDTQNIISLCKKNNIIVIEDCAHVFSNNKKESPTGFMGDCSIYALHKVLPMEKGGVLRVNNPKYNYLCQQKQTLESIDYVRELAYIDHAKASTRRIENYKKLAGNFLRIERITLIYPHLPDNTIPFNLPVLVDDSLREKLYFKLIELNVPVVALYYRMIKEIKVTDFPISYQLTSNILNFPIHQEIDDEQLDFMVKMTIRALNEID